MRCTFEKSRYALSALFSMERAPVRSPRVQVPSPPLFFDTAPIARNFLGEALGYFASDAVTKRQGHLKQVADAWGRSAKPVDNK